MEGIKKGISNEFADGIARGISKLTDVLDIEAAQAPALNNNTYELIANAAKKHGKGPALSFFVDMENHKKPVTWSYKELLAGIHRTANLFRSLGITRNDTVAYILPNLPETQLTIWGAQTAGRVAALNPLLEGAAQAELLKAVEAKVLVILAPLPGTDLWNKIKPHLNEVSSLRHVVMVDATHHIKGRKQLVAKPLQKAEHWLLKAKHIFGSPLPWGAQVHSFHEAIRKFSGKKLSFKDRPTLDDVSSCFCTGGTTGLPKVAKRSQRNEVFSVWSVSQFFGDGVGPGKRILCGLPLFHVNGVLVTGLLPFSTGAHVLMAGPQGYRTPGLVKNFWEVVDHHKINFFSGVPTLYASLLDVPVGKYDISSLEYGLCGAAPLPEEVLKQFESRIGIKILEGYGLTEGTCVSSVNPPKGEGKTGSIGIRIPGQQMKPVLLNEQGEFQRDCAVGEVGQLAICGPNVFLGYLTDEQNKGLWIDRGDGQQWLNTGDLGRTDEQGYFYLTGRKKELIIRGGHNIDPKMIEDVLHQHPAVQMAAALGQPDAHAGELPVAYVQLKQGNNGKPINATAQLERELIDFCNQHLAERAAIPKAITVLQELPLTPVGKIFKPELKKLEIAKATRQLLDKAGIAIESLQVEQSKKHGFETLVLLAREDQLGEARQVLGRLPLRYDIQAAPIKEVA